ncbi:unnamed protein product [Diatraea saccharalis]|uniref:Uncharacterized protein n=1 Tax=Diatraea saccharalis TaxID=40085 RepID=A0A9N9WHR3_9NEOP|nr:unnamed protein product [Diatraea saccharalis]
MNRFDNISKHDKEEENNARGNCTKQNKILELDLDYLERGGGGTLTVGGAPSVEPSPDSLELIKVVLLGAPAVGKTSIIQVLRPLQTRQISFEASRSAFPPLSLSTPGTMRIMAPVAAFPHPFPGNSQFRERVVQ